ncbi:sulfotransferase [Desulfurobacterium sp. TC5-1]|uniref:sulfotransferase family protein n=1 Tax=Desulfurobacterium sp. TC5-1 TaxID=1158318 RepID=UPI0003B578D9|nr:sulfotransferase [Desulfurobacterium sp. TC5-1]
MKCPPVIIVGMHRSGTSLLSRVLQKCGIFMGASRDPNNEPFFFLELNDWLLAQANATWDNPYNFRFIDDTFKEILVKAVKVNISSFKILKFLGVRRFLKYRKLDNLPFLWGWKDPRNSITLNIWSEIFPQAKIIHIYRNPVDVAESLRRRVLKNKNNFRWNYKQTIKAIFAIGKLNFVDSVRLQFLEEGVKLWEEYLKSIYDFEKRSGKGILHLKYEEFLENPIPTIESVLNWLNVSIDGDRIKKATSLVNASRSYAFLSNERLVEFYRNLKGKPLVRKLGYHNLC